MSKKLTTILLENEERIANFLLTNSFHLISTNDFKNETPFLLEEIYTKLYDGEVLKTFMFSNRDRIHEIDRIYVIRKYNGELSVNYSLDSTTQIIKYLRFLGFEFPDSRIDYKLEEKIKYLENKINKLTRDIGMSEYVIEETRDYIEKMTDHIAQMTDHIEEKKDCLQKTKQSLEKEIKKLKKAK